MAVSESIRLELDAIFDARSEAVCLYEALESVQGDSSSPLVYLVRRHVERWALACDALERTLRVRAVPLLKDFEGVTK